MEKQIEEMRKDVASIHRFFFEDDDYEILDDYIADMLFNKGYRKASDVAEELINAALSKIQIMISAIKAQEDGGNITEFNGGAKTALEIVLKDLAELKKKYTEEENNGI